MFQRATAPETREWVHIPSEHGWYWHRFLVGECPVYNLCCVSIIDGSLFVHYLGEPDQQMFRAGTNDMFWGPLSPPVTARRE